MAFGKGAAGSFKLDNSGGTLTDISAYVNSVALNRGQGAYDVTVLAAAAKAFIPGLTDGTVTVGGPWDPTADVVLDGNIGKATTSSVEFGPAGGTAGATTPVFQFECIVTSYSTTGPVDAPTGCTATLQIRGAVTRDGTP